MAVRPDPSCRDVLYGMLTSQWTISDIEDHEAQLRLGSDEASTVTPVKRNLEMWLQDNPLPEASIYASRMI
jgi:hypothetical protein